MQSKQHLKDDAIRLRTEKRYSLDEIASELDVSKGTASMMLRGCPLTKEEILERHRSSVALGRRKKCEDQPLSKFCIKVPWKKLTRLQKAKLSEAAALYRLILHGFCPFGSMFDGDKSDWLVDVPGGTPLRVQVKSSKKGEYGSPLFVLQCSNGRRKVRPYLDGELDIFVGYDYETDTCYVWKWQEISHLASSVSATEDAKERWDKLKTGGGSD